MCGICGFIGQGSPGDLERMNKAMFHRGPDSEGKYIDGEKHVYLGHRRLSIIDISGGHQPMWTSDGSMGIVFNGEIYNHIELRRELLQKGYLFQTDHSDTEVLLQGFKEWGPDLPQKLNGMWALAIYNKKEGKIFCSRDRFGKKPFFYSLQNGTFAFASELSALKLHSNIKSFVSNKSLQKFFAYGYIPAPSSLFEGVYKLPGGYNLFLDCMTLSYRTVKYWDFELEPFDSIPQNPEDAWSEELLYLLKKAVERRLISDVPLGVFLSGGIDSSSVTAFASQIAGEGKLKTFSIGFEEPSFDESEYALKVSKLFKTDHYSEILSMDKARILAPDIIGKLDEPMGDSSILPTYLLSQVTRKKVTVALSGDGADELFAGYDPFKAVHLAEIYNSLVPKPFHEALRMVIACLPTSHVNMSLDFKLKRTLRGLSYPKKFWNSIWLGSLSPDELKDLFSEKIDPEELYSEAIDCWESCKQKNIVDKTLQFYTKLYLQDDILVKTDRASMMHSLEVRAPFLDIDLVNFVRRIPHDYKYRKGTTKYILKKALGRILPAKILYRRKKGFGVPIGKWFQEGSLEFRTGKRFGRLNEDFFKRYLAEHKRGNQDNRAFLWNYFALIEGNKNRNQK